MSKYEMSELIKRWELGKISEEQMIGQLLLYTDELVQQMGKMQRQLDLLLRQLSSAEESLGEER